MGRRLQTVAAITIMKVLLMLFNLLFWVTGIAILSVGIWSFSSISSYFELGLSAAYYKTASFILIGTGAGIVILATLGCFCTIKGKAFFLYLYSGFLLLIFIAEIATAIVGYKYRNHLKDSFKQGLVSAIGSYTPDNQDEMSRAVDKMQTELRCCGANNFTDWERGGTGYSPEIPQSCCRQPPCDTKPSSADVSVLIHKRGCYHKVIDYLQSNMHVIAGTALGIAFFQVVGVVLSCCLARNISKATYERVA